MATTLDNLTLEILAERCLTHFDSKKLVDWAVQVLELGYESNNLFVLAGLDHDTTIEREECFWKSVKDLNLEVEKNEDKLIKSYALTIANKAIRKEIGIDYAFGQMLKVVLASGYDNKYIAFFEIDEDLDYLNYRNLTLFNAGLTLENANDFILEELKIFAEMESLKIPHEERNQCYCENCKNFNTPLTISKFQFKRPFKYMVWGCGIFKSEKLKYQNEHNVKRMIIDKFKTFRS
ncbi:hypothetical protein FAZ19_09995 [Sphingobacterium alkalisoli]|uniref:Uncharacterized protein n=1 Tax=Sphingobacterium alkalisoli TaxID=1874115 RepID=A0A4U0H1L5_9SPHI|nr:hypothetical protein [Sphingobacterium alkalisoli]TJY65465.1 hypothetical protein FAZ19_09995 [Sphingobacterium alkalisoli]GGH20300.1 hypothetical protein GCM10011418_25380 [Sphingobacterium alkalisoli]